MARRYDREFKVEALRLAGEPGTTDVEVERRLGIGQGCLGRWRRQLAAQGQNAFPGKGHLPGPEPVNGFETHGRDI